MQTNGGFTVSHDPACETHLTGCADTLRHRLYRNTVFMYRSLVKFCAIKVRLFMPETMTISSEFCNRGFMNCGLGGKERSYEKRRVGVVIPQQQLLRRSRFLFNPHMSLSVILEWNGLPLLGEIWSKNVTIGCPLQTCPIRKPKSAP